MIVGDKRFWFRHFQRIETTMLAPGTPAPAFSLRDQNGRERSLSALLAGGALILYFYPADFTPVCTAQACTLRDLHTSIRRAGLQVVGVSPQSIESHRRFKEEHKLPFTLLADPEKKVVKSYDVDGPFGFGVRRATYLIDQRGVIQDGALADFRVARHEEFVRRASALRDADG